MLSRSGAQNNRKRALLPLLCFLTACTRPATAPETAETAPPEPEVQAVYASVEAVNTWQEADETVTQYELHLQNEETEIHDWMAVLSVPEDTDLRQNWNSSIQVSEKTWVLSPEDYNREIPAGESLKDVGWIAVCGTDALISLQSLEINGSQVRIAEPSDSSAVPAVPSEPATPEPLSERAGPLHVMHGKLCDEKDNPVQLRGVSTHGLAWFPNYVNEEAFRHLRDDWHVNTIRLAMYTAENGGYCTDGNREELLDLIDQGVAYTEALGMYVIIDWHILSDANPGIYQSEAEQFFDLVSEKYGDKTHVLYEICNEPQESPFREVIKPYAEDIIKAIRKNDADAVILVGTNTWSQDVDDVIGNELDDSNVMYTLHFYAGTHKDALRKKLRTALDAGLPVYISECSIVDAPGNGPVDYTSAEEWLSLIRTYGISYNAWSLCNKNESSALISPACNKVSGWTEEDLSETGKWFRNAFRGN